MITPCFALHSDRLSLVNESGQDVGPVFVFHGRRLLLRGEPTPDMRAQHGITVEARADHDWPGTPPSPARVAAVLCPGPSLSETWPGSERYETVLAVNRAAELEPPDWLVTSRREPIWPRGAAGTFVTTGDAPLRFAKPERDCVGTHPTTAAVALAAWLGHGVIHVYGDDRAGAQRFDGTTCNDDPARWRREGAAFSALEWNLAQVGCRVERILT